MRLEPLIAKKFEMKGSEKSRQSLLDEILMYISVKQAAEKWGISDRRVRILCSEGKIPGVIREGRSWKIPEEAKKPEDGRYRSAASLLEMIDRKKAELDTRRPLTEGEVERLTEEFVVEYTYNSNAIEGNTLTLRDAAWSHDRSKASQRPYGGGRT